MPRIRTIKPEFFTSEDIVALSPLARLAYQALWCEADREGRLIWKPGTWKLRYFPADLCSVHDLCKELTDRGLVVRYEVDGEEFAHIPRFAQHQHLNPRESASVIPAPDTPKNRRVGTRRHASLRDSDAQGGREGKGREGNVLVLSDESTSPNRADGDGSDAPQQSYEVPPCPIEDIAKAYHEVCPTLPKVAVLSEFRRGLVRQRWREVCAEERFSQAQGIEWFREFFGTVAASKFLTGRSPKVNGHDRAFHADFEWLVRPQNFVKVVEGKYL